MKKAGHTLAAWLRVQDMQRQEFADVIGETPSQVSRWINGRATPQFKARHKIFKATAGAVKMEDWE